MYRRPRFLEELQAIREEMSRECDYDIDLFAEMVRSNTRPPHGRARNIRGYRQYAPLADSPAPLATPPASPLTVDQPTRKKK
jgi:hypothetical protein